VCEIVKSKSEDIKSQHTDTLSLQSACIHLHSSPVSIQTQSLALRLDGNRAKRLAANRKLGRSSGNSGFCQRKRLRLARFPSKRNASDCVWMETGLHTPILQLTGVFVLQSDSASEVCNSSSKQGGYDLNQQ